MAFPYNLDLYNTDSYHYDLNNPFGDGIPIHHRTTSYNETTAQSSRTASPMGSLRGTPNSTPRGSVSSMRGSVSKLSGDLGDPSNSQLKYHPTTGVFQSAESVAPSNNANSKEASTAKGKEKRPNTNTFSSMSSSMNRPRGSVFKRALFSVGIPTKESRLLTAAETGDVEAVSWLLASGVDVNWRNEHGETALVYASWGGHEPVVAALLHHPAMVANLQDNEGWTALMWASKAGHEGVVRLFLVHPDTEPDLSNNLGETALMKASVQGHAKVVRQLTASYRTTVDKKHPDGSTALLWASAGGSIQCVNVLLDANADIDSQDMDGMNSLMWAVSVGHVEVVELLIQRGCDMSQRDKIGRTPLLMAAEVGHAEVASFLLTHDGTDVNLTTKDRISSLMRAASRGHSPLVNMLVKCRDIDVNLQDSQGRTALIYAARSGQALCVSILLQHPEILCNIQDTDGFSASAMAANYGHDEALNALLKCNKCNLHLHTRHGLTSLSLAARSGKRTTVKALLTHPSVGINETDGQSMTALAWASKQGSVLVVELLQQYQKLRPNLPISDGTTPLMWAARGNQLLVVQTLLRDPRVDPIAVDNAGKTALDWATENNFEDVIHFLRRYQEMSSIVSSGRNKLSDNLNGSSSVSDNSDYQSASVIAARYEKGHVDANVDNVSDVNRFLENGPYVNWRPKSGKTSFAWAVSCGQTEVVKVFLLVPNLDVNEVDNEGFTPLMIAACSGHTDVVRLLLTHEKTDVNRGDRIGRTALMMAATNSHLRSLCNLLSCSHIQVNNQDIAGHTALTLAAQIGLYEITCELLKHPTTKSNICTTEGGSPLIYAVRGGHEEVSELLLERTETDVNAITEKGESALLLAAGYQGCVKITRMLLNHMSVNVNLRAPAGHSALLLAARNDHLECCRLLMEQQNINVNLQDLGGMTALMFASLLGHEDMVRILFSHPGTDPNLKCKENGSTALILAARNNRANIIEILLGRKNVEVNITDDYAATALSHCIRRNSREGVYHLLERPDIDINISDAEGKTPLIRACADGYYDLAMILLARSDVDVNRQTLEGKSSLMYAAQMPEGLAALKLILAIADVEVNAIDEHESTGLLYACKNGNTDSVSAILEACSMEPPEPDGGFALMKPTKKRGLHLLKEARDDQGYTPLMWATLLGFTDIVRRLLQVRGLDVNAVSPDGLTSLGLACESGHVTVVQALTSHPSVDVNAGQEGGEGGRTAIVAALERYQHECVCILLQHPAHSLARSGVRTPYLPPMLKNMVDLYRQHQQVRGSLVLSCPPPSLVVDGTGGQKGGRSVAGGAEAASALLRLPRPFQVVQHELRKATTSTLANHVKLFTQRLDQSQPGVVLLYISGEILITPEGPALSLSSLTPHTPPTNVLLSSIISAHHRSPALIMIVDILCVSVTPSLQQAKHVMKSPEAHALPPLCHHNMAVIAGVNGQKKQVFGGPKCSEFSEVLTREMLHGVTLQQLHHRVASILHQQAVQTSKLQDQCTTRYVEGVEASADAAKPAHTLPVEVLVSKEGKQPNSLEVGNAEETAKGSFELNGVPEGDKGDIQNNKKMEETAPVEGLTTENEKEDMDNIAQESSTVSNTEENDKVDKGPPKNDVEHSGYNSIYAENIPLPQDGTYDSFSSIRAKFDSALRKLSVDSVDADIHNDNIKNVPKDTKDSAYATKTISPLVISELLDSKEKFAQSSDNNSVSSVNDSNATIEGSVRPSSLPLHLVKSSEVKGSSQDASSSLSSAASTPSSQFSVAPRLAQKTTVLFASNMTTDWRF